MKSVIWSVVKYVLAALLLVIIIKHAGVETIAGYLKQIPPFKLILSLVLIGIAQFISGLRMRFFFRSAEFHLNVRYASILFFVGSFYNFLLPGGIGGDAYKVILARRRMSMTAKQGIRIMVADRASGLCVLMFTMFAGLLLLDLSAIPYAHLLIAAAFVVTLAGYLFFSRWLLLKRPRTMLASLPYSIVGQGFWMLGLWVILSALGGAKSTIEYIVLYCAASITGMLPVSVGGLGIKEMTYFYGAQQLQHYTHSDVSADLGVALSLCMFFLIFATSLPGLLWLNKVEKADYN